MATSLGALKISSAASGSETSEGSYYLSSVCLFISDVGGRLGSAKESPEENIVKENFEREGRSLET
jgi:hypothetical protein